MAHMRSRKEVWNAWDVTVSETELQILLKHMHGRLLGFRVI